MNVRVEDIENDPREYLDRALHAETGVITREDDEPVAEIRPLRNGKGRRPIGLAKRELVVPDDFDDPLPDDILDAFEGKRGSFSKREA